MAMDPSNQSKRNLERVTLGLQASSFLVHVFCCGLPLIVSLAAFGGLAGITVLPFGFESWFHKHELLIFFLALVMVAVSAGLQMMGHQHAKSTHHDHHDCSNHRVHVITNKTLNRHIDPEIICPVNWPTDQ